MIRAYVALGLLMTFAALAASLALYPQMADEIPIHWNIKGQVDDYGAKQWAAFLVPGIMVGMMLLAFALPWLSPKQFEVDTFRSTYWLIMLMLIALMAYIHGLMLWAALAGPVNTSRALVGGMCLFFALLGNVLGKVRRNFWVGVRTPWTIASERVWNDTHRLAAWLFVAAGSVGFVLALSVPSPVVSTVAVLVCIMVAALVPVIYSLVLYKRLQRRGELQDASVSP